MSDFEIVSADRYTLAELTDAYNETRVDYMVPMPMNLAKLREYVRLYDVKLKASQVAVGEDDMILGLGMLGVRDQRAWITRLGVLPYGRRLGVGQGIMEGLVAASEKLGLKQVWLEVIQGNVPGLALFHKFGFQETRELIVARRPPSPNTQVLPSGIKHSELLDHEEALNLLNERKGTPNWLKQPESMAHVQNLSALVVELDNGGRGWVCFHADLLQLTRMVVEVDAGDPAEVSAATLQTLHRHYKRQDAKIENIPDDAIWAGFVRAGYFESFRRIEMVKELG